MAEIIFDSEKHEYRAGGRKLPSVTQILYAVGMYKDLDNIPRHILEVAAERGKIVHEIIELHCKGELDESSIDPELMGYFQAYLSCRSDHPEIFENLTEFEQMGYSEKYGYCGKYDAAGDRLIVDWKTTALPSPVHGLQMSGYWLSKHPDIVNDKPDGLYCPYFHLDGTYNLVKYDFQPVIWLNCVAIYNWQKRNGI